MQKSQISLIHWKHPLNKQRDDKSAVVTSYHPHDHITKYLEIIYLIMYKKRRKMVKMRKGEKEFKR